MAVMRVSPEEARTRAEPEYQQANHQQPGDPAKLGPAIVELTNAEAPPLHLLLGSDALGTAREELAARSVEIDTWASLSASTDHDHTT
jgi:hypothetical protein